jgi:hypothetical protein
MANSLQIYSLTRKDERKRTRTYNCLFNILAILNRNRENCLLQLDFFILQYPCLYEKYEKLGFICKFKVHQYLYMLGEITLFSYHFFSTNFIKVIMSLDKKKLLLIRSSKTFYKPRSVIL